MANFIGKNDFIDAMRHAAAAVSIVTTHDANGQRVGMTISAMCSVTTDPPSLLVCLHGQSSVAKLTETSGVFCVNVLSAGHVQLADCFAGRVPEMRERKFELGNWGTLVTGAPVLQDAEAMFDCRVSSRTQIGTHVVLVGAVEGVRTNETSPLLYLDRRYRVLNEPCAAA